MDRPVLDKPAAPIPHSSNIKSTLEFSTRAVPTLKVRKIEIFFGFDFEICIISLFVM